jgi:hypothetical protein
MKIIIRKIANSILFLVLVIVISGTSAVLARDIERQSESANTPRADAAIDTAGKLYCDKATGLLSAVGQKLGDFNAKLQQSRIQIAARLRDGQEKRDQNLEKVRQQWADNRQRQITALDEMAKTDAQKQAIAEFKAETTKTILIRQRAVDSAIMAYRNGLSKIVSDRKAAVDLAKTALKNSAQAAASKAKADCDGGVDPQTMRQNLQESLKTAREKYTGDIQTLEKNRVEATLQLRTARKEAVQKAVDEFQAVMEKARTEMKAALGEIPPLVETDSAQPAQ